MKYKKLRGVIFDLDGTLLDTLADMQCTVNSVLLKYDYPPHSISKYKEFIGNGIENTLLAALPNNYKEDFYTLLEETKRSYLENLNKNTTVYDGIYDILDYLIRSEIRLGVVTNKLHKYATKCVEVFFNRYNLLTLGAGKNYSIKPNPEGTKYVASELGVDPDHCLFVGDSGVDMQTAKRAGMISAGVLWGFREKKELENTGADFIFSTTIELNEFFKNNI